MKLTLGDFVEISKETIDPSRHPSTCYKLFSIPAFDAGQAERVMGDEIASNKFVIDKLAILVSKLNPRIPRIWKIEDPSNNSICSTEFIVLQPRKKSVGKLNYIWAVLSSPIFQKFMLARIKGTSGSHQRVKPEDILKFPMPSGLDERFVGDLFCLISEKISLNRQMNKTLEKWGQNLFNHNFVANPKAKNWPIVNIGEAVDIKGGSTPSTKDRSLWDGGIAWTSPRDLAGKSDVFLTKTEQTITEQGLTKISSGLLPAGTLLLSSRAPIGYVAIAAMPLAINQGYIAFLSGAKLSNAFMFFWLKRNMENVKSAANGSTFMEVSKKNFRTIKILLPDEVQLENFEKQIQPIFAKMKNSQQEAAVLMKLRDSLLPRLIAQKVEA